MINKLSDIKICPVCNKTRLSFIPNYIHEDIENNSYYGDEIVFRTDDIIKCEECDTIFYIEDGKLVSQFDVKINTPVKKINWVSDQEVTKNKNKI